MHGVRNNFVEHTLYEVIRRLTKYVGLVIVSVISMSGTENILRLSGGMVRRNILKSNCRLLWPELNCMICLVINCQLMVSRYRITSYNVCYTKLLRMFSFIFMEQQEPPCALSRLLFPPWCLQVNYILQRFGLPHGYQRITH